MAKTLIVLDTDFFSMRKWIRYRMKKNCLEWQKVGLDNMQSSNF